MKAITLWQPWASLIALEVKQVETRSWSTRHRGPLAIHAAATKAGWRGASFKLDRLLAMHGLANPDTTPLGCIVATCYLVACVPMTRPVLENVSLVEHMTGEWAEGRWAWMLSEIKALEVPIPCRGAQGLWTLDESDPLVRDLIIGTASEPYRQLQQGEWVQGDA